MVEPRRSRPLTPFQSHSRRSEAGTGCGLGRTARAARSCRALSPEASGLAGLARDGMTARMKGPSAGSVAGRALSRVPRFRPCAPHWSVRRIAVASRLIPSEPSVARSPTAGERGGERGSDAHSLGEFGAVQGKFDRATLRQGSTPDGQDPRLRLPLMRGLVHESPPTAAPVGAPQVVITTCCWIAS